MIVQKINMHISTEERGWKAFKMDSAVWEAEKRCKPLQKSLKFLSHAKIVNFTRLKYEVWKVAIFDIISTNELETDRFRRQYDEMERYLTILRNFFWEFKEVHKLLFQTGYDMKTGYCGVNQTI